MRAQHDSVPHLAPKSEVITLDLSARTSSMASIREDYYNDSHLPITVVNRNGTRAVIPPGQRGGVLDGGRFVIQQIQEFHRPVILDNADLSNDYGTQTSELSKQIIQALGVVRHNQGFFGSVSQHRVILSHTLDVVEISRRGGAVYVPELDLLISTRVLDQVPPHPYSLLGIRQKVSKDRTLQSEDHFHYQVRIVDRAQIFSHRWININGTAFRIPSVEVSDDPDGVYLSTARADPVDPRRTKVVTEYYPFDKVHDHLTLYQTQNEAATLGDPQSAYKRELEAEKHRNTMEAERLRLEKLKSDLEHSTRMRELEKEREEAKARLMRQEDALKDKEARLQFMEAEFKVREEQLKRDQFYSKHAEERKSLNRKIFLETMKFLGAAAIGAATVYKTIQKLSEKK